MRLKLDFEDVVSLATVSGPEIGQYRSLIVNVNGKTFQVWLRLDPYLTHYNHKDRYMRSTDEKLVECMERMLTQIFLDACAAVPEGKDLLGVEQS